MRNTRFIDNHSIINPPPSTFTRRRVRSTSGIHIAESGTHFVPQHQFRVDTTITDRQRHFLACRNRSGCTLEQEIIHRRHQDLIDQGQPVTVDLWYPPRGTTVAQHIANLATTRNSI